MDRYARTKQHIALPTAAATAYFQITGRQVDGRRDEHTQKTLDDIAQALSVLVPIYSNDGSWDMPRQVQRWQLEGARFERGAHTLVLLGGMTLRRLTIQRDDLDKAIRTLQELTIP